MKGKKFSLRIKFIDDDNLIVLEPVTEREDCQNDYINACFVDVSADLHYI